MLNQKVLYKSTLLFSFIFGVLLSVNTGLSNHVLAMFFISVLFICIKQKQYFVHLKDRYKLLFISTLVLFILTFFSFLFTEDFEMGIKRGETRLSFCLIPMLLVAVDYRIIKFILQFFYKGLVLGSVISGVFLILAMVYRLESNPDIEFFGYFNTHHVYSGPLSIHATYLSLYYLSSICILHFDKKIIPINILLRSFITLLIFFNILMLSSRVIILAGAPILAYSLLRDYGLRVKLTVLVIVLTTFLTAVLYSSDSFLMSRFKQIENELLGSSQQGSELRFSRWDVALDVVKSKPLFGYGLGMEKDVLEAGYKKNGLIDSSRYRYDSHNQILSTLITAGVIGFSILCLFFIRLLSFFYLKKNWFNLLFLFLIISLCFVETTFNVNTFTTFFAFFVNMNLFKYSA